MSTEAGEDATATEPAPVPAAPRVFEWHRVEAAGNILVALFVGAGVLFLGPTLAAISFLFFKTQPLVHYGLLVVGAVCITVGPASAILRLARSLRDEAFLAARGDGVVFERNGKALHMTWDDLERVEFQAPTTLLFRLREGEPFVLHERFAMIETAELGKRLEDLRRKASFGLLPPRRSEGPKD